MKKSKSTEEQIAFALHRAQTGTSVEEVCRKIGVSQATFDAWKKKLGGMGVSELRRLRQLLALDEARHWAAEFVHWHNFNHQHSGIRFVSPAQRHAGEYRSIPAKHHALYLQA